MSYCPMMPKYDIGDAFAKLLYGICIMLFIAVGIIVLTLLGIGVYELIQAIFRLCYPELI